MNKHEKVFSEWLEKEQAERGLVYVTYATSNGDCSSEEFFAEANAMNATDAIVVDGKEDFPRYSLEEIFGKEKSEALVDEAIDIAISAGKCKELKFNDATG